MQQFIGVIEMTVVLIEFDMSDCCGRARLCFERSRSSHDLCVLAHVHMINAAARKPAAFILQEDRRAVRQLLPGHVFSIIQLHFHS